LPNSSSSTMNEKQKQNIKSTRVLLHHHNSFRLSYKWMLIRSLW
jgi:hypothetical protein